MVTTGGRTAATGGRSSRSLAVAAGDLSGPQRATAAVVSQQLARLIAAVVQHGALGVATGSGLTCLEVQMKELGFLAARVGTLLAQHTVLQKQASGDLWFSQHRSVSSDPAIKIIKAKQKSKLDHGNENDASY